jgi:DNA-binding FadR family transcriptional regulator
VLAALIAALHAESSPDAQATDGERGDQATLRHHQQIVDAIAARDADEAEAAVIAHLSFIRSQPS